MHALVALLTNPRPSTKLPTAMFISLSSSSGIKWFELAISGILVRQEVEFG